MTDKQSVFQWIKGLEDWLAALKEPPTSSGATSGETENCRRDSGDSCAAGLPCSSGTLDDADSMTLDQCI